MRLHGVEEEIVKEMHYIEKLRFYLQKLPARDSFQIFSPTEFCVK